MGPWENYGDVNFVEYGGMLVRQDEYGPRSFQILSVATPDASPDIEEGHVWAWLCAVDLEDSWMDNDAVADFAGWDASTSNMQKACDMISYYGPENFSASSYHSPYAGGAEDVDITVEELKQWLEDLDAGEFA